MRELGFEIETEYQFARPRKFRFDVYLVRDKFGCDVRVGLEADGGRYARGHRSARDTDSNNEKFRLAQLLGYRILPFTNEEVLRGEAKELIREWFCR